METTLYGLLLQKHLPSVNVFMTDTGESDTFTQCVVIMTFLSYKYRCNEWFYISLTYRFINRGWNVHTLPASYKVHEIGVELHIL